MDDVQLPDAPSRAPADRSGSISRGARVLAVAASFTAVAAAAVVTFGTIRSSVPADATSVPVRGEPGGTGFFPWSPAVGQPGELWRSGPVRPAARAVTRDRIDVTAEDGTVVVSDGAGLAGLDPVHGEVRWLHPVGPTAGAPTLTGGTALVSTVHAVVAVDTDTGTERWQAETGPEHRARVVAAGSGVVMIAERHPESDVLVGLSLADGTRRWERPLPDGHRSRAAPTGATADHLVGGRVAVVHVASGGDPGSPGADDDAVTHRPAPLLAVELATGEELWSTSRPASAYVVDDVTVVLLTTPGGQHEPAPELVARDLGDGHVRWRTTVRRTAQVLATTGRAIHLAEGATVTEFAPHDGRERRFSLDRVVTPALGASRVGDLLIITTSSRNSMAIAAPDVLLAVHVGDGTIAWSREGASSGPAVAGETVVVTTDDGVEAVGADDGEQRWAFRAERPGSCTAARAGRAVVVAIAGRVLALDPADGRLLAELSRDGSRRPPPFRVVVPPSVDVTSQGRGPLVAVAAPGERALGTTVTAWRPNGGDEVWRRRAHPARLFPPLLATEDTLLVVAGVRQPTLTALTSATGAVRWSRHLGPSAATRPAGRAAADPGADQLLAARDGLVIVTDRGRLAAWAIADGRELWVSEHDGAGVVTDAVLGDDTVLVTDGATVSGLSAATGGTRWTHQLSAGAGATSLALAPGVAVVASDEDVLALDERSGEPTWAAALTSPVVGGVSIAAGRVHVATAAGIDVLDLASGEQVGASSTERAPISAPLLADGRIYLCHADGTVAAYH